VKALKEVEMGLKGNVIDPLKSQQFDLSFTVAPFSPRKLMAAARQPFPLTTADPQVLNRVAVKGNVTGNTQSISISEGTLELDESKMNFSLKAKDFSKPDLAFDLKLDKINLDQYLPSSAKEKTGREEKKAEPKKTDYTALRKLVLDGGHSNRVSHGEECKGAGRAYEGFRGKWYFSHGSCDREAL
jgi:AsmA protein